MKHFTEIDSDDDDTLKDGQSLRVSVSLMDAAARRPSHPNARQMLDTSGPEMNAARQRARLSMAWRDGVTDAEIENEARRRVTGRQADEAALARHEATHDAYSDALMKAWQR